MKNVLLVTQGFPFGNSERGFLETEYKRLSEKAKVHILAITDMEVNGNEQAEVFRNYNTGFFEGISQLKRSEVREDIKLACKAASFGLALKRTKRILSYSTQAEHIQKVIERIIKEKNIDIVYTYWCLPATVAACRLKEKYDIKIVTRFHGFDLYKFREPCGWQPLRQYISHGADRLVFASVASKDYFVNNIAGCKSKCEVSYIGTKPAQSISVNCCDNLLRIISCSYIVTLKRVNLIAEVILQLSKNIDVEWYHIGGPSQKFDFLDRENIKYKIYGNVEHEKIEEIYNSVRPDVFITLSTTEGGVPVSIQEAMSMGIPAIGTNVGGIPEIIRDNYNGFIVPVDTDISNVVSKLLEFNSFSQNKREQLSLASYDTWKDRFDANKNAIRFVDKILEL